MDVESFLRVSKNKKKKRSQHLKKNQKRLIYFKKNQDCCLYIINFVNYYALNLNLRIFVDILTMLLDAVEFLALRLLINDTIFVMFCLVK